MSKVNWKDYADQALQICTEDPSFGGYTAREKLLAYCYTLLQEMKPDREAIKAYWQNWLQLMRSEEFASFRKAFHDFSEILIQEGVERGEIQPRFFISGMYPELLWAALLGIITFWVNDKSENTEQTDVAVEKLVHLAFDAIAPNAVDSALDVLQFLMKQRLNG